MDLKLNQEVEPLPVDTELTVRAKSALGLKYLEIRKGSSEESYPAGSIIPLSQAKPEPVDIDEVLGTFDDETRRASQLNLLEFGNALAGRGEQINSALGELEPLLPPLERVTRNLAKPDTGLGRFVRAISDTATEVAPVAEQQAQMFVSLDTTFAALASVARPYIQETISESVPTLDLGTRVLPRLRPFLRHSTTLFAELRPGVDGAARKRAHDRLCARDRCPGAATCAELQPPHPAGRPRRCATSPPTPASTTASPASPKPATF